MATDYISQKAAWAKPGGGESCRRGLLRKRMTLTPRRKGGTREDLLGAWPAHEARAPLLLRPRTRPHAQGIRTLLKPGERGGQGGPGLEHAACSLGPALTPLSDRAPTCGAAVKPEGGPRAILHVLRRVLEAEGNGAGRLPWAQGEPVVCSGKLLSLNRKQRKNHTSKLQELALLLPVALKTRTKKLTKKEILLHVLHYIQYLQRNIDVAKALLKLYTNRESGLGGLSWNPAGGPVRRRHSTPCSSPCSRKTRLRGACRKPRKKKQIRTSECQTRAQKPRRCLTLCKPEKVTPPPDQKGGNAEATTTPLRCANSGGQPKAAPSSPRGGENRGRAQLTVLDMAEDGAHRGLASCCYGNSVQDDEPYPALGVQKDAEKVHFLIRTQPCPRQKLVFYDSSEEVDKESPDADPWLPAWTPEGSPHESPLALGSPQIGSWSAKGHSSEILGLSPSLFSSPGRLLPEQLLEDGAVCLTQALFEEVYFGPESPLSACKSEAPENKDTLAEAPRDPTDAHSLFQSSVSLDHCYLSLSETSPGSGTTETESPWKQQGDAQADPEEDVPSSSEEDGDYTWTPTRRASVLPPGGRKAKKGRASRAPVKPKESKKVPCPTQIKKKCVNGFIMFCRMNRKQYIRACPGTASTAATKELAQLWRMMTQQERKPYCIKARRFSRQHNRIVKQESSSSEDDDWEPPKPFYQLLAEKARSSPEPAALPPPRQ
ncbi:meiosis initiator protein [Trichechus manatus latirostris]|uniref:Meiosis initiator protein n=1 Tax=Trichechus manatus latirostris TaxID=127582 RepID=A0A2Y9RES2_TRIMA|nr:meiosis initiator protein [Trichechus manatus latirostris]